MLLSLQTFDETMRSGCMELTVTGVSYNIHMSTVSIINGRNVEGRLSDVTGETSVFVPKPGDTLILTISPHNSHTEEVTVSLGQFKVLILTAKYMQSAICIKMNCPCQAL